MSALGSAISGLQSSQKWLDVISNNVSNSQTVAYKGSRANFSDLMSDGIRGASGPSSASNLGGINPSQLGLGVTVSSVQTIMKQGSTQVTGNATDVAIQGAGFLTVSKGEETLYTRSGNLTFDQSGNLVTSDGGQVQGWQMKSFRTPSAPGPMTLIQTKLDTSNPAGIPNIQIPNNMVLAPKATSMVGSPTIKDQGVILQGNLDNATPTDANKLPMGGVITAVQLSNFTPDATTVSTVYDTLGTAWTFTMLWQQVQPIAGGQAQWEWTMWYTPAGAVPNTAALWSPTAQAGSLVADSGGFVAGFTPSNNSSTGTAGQQIQFNPDGSLQDNGTGLNTNVQIQTSIPNGAVGSGGANGVLQFSLNFGTPDDPAAAVPTYGLRDGLTGDYGNGTVNPLTGVYQPNQTIYNSFVDGYSEGTLTGLNFNANGGIDARFSNNQTVTVAQVALSKFANQDGLERAGGNYFRQTGNSGLAQVGTAGSAGFGLVQGGALEASNVDLTVELTNMILAQRMFESNARVVTSADKVLDTLVNLGR